MGKRKRNLSCKTKSRWLRYSPAAEEAATGGEEGFGKQKTGTYRNTYLPARRTGIRHEWEADDARASIAALDKGLEKMEVETQT